MSIFSSKLTYGDFSRTGTQDCQNAVSIDEFDYEGGGTARQIVERSFASWEDDGMKEQWLEQQDDDFEGLDPDKCYDAWAGSWKERAVSYVQHELDRRAREQHENPAQVALTKLFAWQPKVEETIVDVHEGRTSYSAGQPILVSRLDSPRGAFWIMDGHHRAVEAVFGGASKIAVAIEPAVPRIERTGGGYSDMLAKKVNLVDFLERESARGNPPAKWWRKPAPAKDRHCYRTKIEALRKFLEVNYSIIENYGGADYKVSPSEFDAINHKYDLKGKRAARTIAEAVYAAMPVGKPYCLDRIDLDALNDTSPAREAGVAFVLPDYVYEAQMAEQEARHMGYGQAEQEPDWVTEHEHEAVQVFPPLPPIPAPPIRLHLVSREGHAETYQMMPPLPPMPPVKPYNVELEEQEPGVATFRFNPAGKVKIKMTSTRSGTVGWIRSDGTPSNHESEAGYFTPDAAQATIDEYTENLVRVVGRCANRFELVPTKNPAGIAVGNYYDVTTASGADQFQIIGYFDKDGVRKWRVMWSDGHLSAIDERSMSSYQAKFSHHDYVAQPKIGNPATPNILGPKSNPAWVTNIISKHYVQLEEQVPPQWLPKLTKPSAARGKLTAAMKEYGCGAYGCVLPTLDPKVVLKLTTDDTEAQFAHEMAAKLTVPVVVKYHLTRALPDQYKGRQAYLLWRDSADHVGTVEQAIAEEGGTDPVVTEEAIGAQHAAAQAAFDALHEGRPATKLLQKWEDAAREMGLMVPELSELAEGMITNLHNDKVFMGDVHAGNIGLVDGRWVVVDPGHVAVLEE